MEKLQEAGATLGFTHEVDFESWRGAPKNIMDLFGFLIDAEPSICTLLSGDVHYASSAAVAIGGRGKEVKVAQFTSSAIKNGPTDYMDVIAKRSSADRQLYWWKVSERVAVQEPTVWDGRIAFWRNPDYVEHAIFRHLDIARENHPHYERASNVALLRVSRNEVTESLLLPGSGWGMDWTLNTDKWPVKVSGFG
jgi:hypothetical protein